MIIKVRNTLADVAPVTSLVQTVAVAGTTLAVQNTAQFTAQWAAQIGRTGEERAEIKVLGASIPSGTALTIAAVSFDHPTDTPVYAIKYDQLVFMRSTAGTAGTASVITNGTVSIAADSPFTQFDDTSGATGYAYQVYYQNSVSAAQSSVSDWITPSGFSFYSKAKIRDRIKNKLFNSGYIGNDSLIDDWINEWLEMMTNTAIAVNEDYALGTVDVAFSGTAELGTITSSDFKQLRRVWFTSDGVTYYQGTKMTMTSYDPQDLFTTAHPYFYMQGDNVIGRKPNDASGTARCVYYKLNSVLVNDTDELPVPMRGYTKSFVDYGLAQAKRKDNKDKEAGELEGMAMGELTKFKGELSPRNQTGPTTILITDPVSGDD